MMAESRDALMELEIESCFIMFKFLWLLEFTRDCIDRRGPF